MVDAAINTSAPGVHPLTGSSPPGEGGPVFDPVAGKPVHTRPRPHSRREVPAGVHYPHPLGLRPVSAEQDIIERTRHIRMLLKHEEALSARIGDEPLNGQTVAEHSRMDRSLRRTVDRIQRLTAELARTKAPTLRAASLKGDLYIEMATLGLTDDHEDDRLALSLAHDACHLATEASCVENLLDGHLLDLIDKHVAAEAQRDRAMDVAERLHTAFNDRRPPIPAALFWRPEDGFSCGFTQKKLPNGNVSLFYDIPQVAAIREMPAPVRLRREESPAPWGDSDVIVKNVVVPDAQRAARIAEIIAGADDLMARTEALADEVGVTEANRLSDEASYLAKGIEDKIMATVPASPAGWLAKAAWLASRTWSEDYLGQLAMQMVTDIATLSKPAQERQPPSRELLESYRTWLHMELQFLNGELDLRGSAAHAFFLDNEAARFHGNGEAPPSTRAAAVLGMFGLLPRPEVLRDNALAPEAAEVAA